MDGTMERVELTRDVDAVAIPAGQALVLEKGTDAFITQSLGGTYTLHVPAYGGLFRIDGKDADAIGKEVTTAPAAETEGGGDIEHRVWEQLKTCYDPEIPVNIVDLGLVYDLRITSEPDGASRVDVKMTLTAHGCGMGASIAADARQKLLMLPGVSAAEVQIVWDPPWNPQMISPEGKERLGIA
jgi:probable FeS assembly SUF system protein SufT